MKTSNFFSVASIALVIFSFILTSCGTTSHGRSQKNKISLKTDSNEYAYSVKTPTGGSESFFKNLKKSPPKKAATWKPSWKESKHVSMKKNVKLNYHKVCPDHPSPARIINANSGSIIKSGGGSYNRGVRILHRMQKEKIRLAKKEKKTPIRNKAREFTG